MIRAYWTFFQKALMAHLAYGGSLLLALFAHAVGFGITLMVWTYALGQQPGREHIFGYLCLAFLLNFGFSISLEQSIGQRVREGLIATDLLKPVDFQLLYMVQAFSDMLFQLMLALIGFGLSYLAYGDALLPPDRGAALAGALSLILAFFVQYGVCFIFVQGIFLTNSNYGVVTTRNALHQTFSGAFAPLQLFPHFMVLTANFLPFRHIVYTPLACWLGWFRGAELKEALLMQAAWAFGLLLAGRLLFRSVMRHTAIQGG